MPEGKRRDLYEVLGVARDVDADTLRKAYRKLARQYHPDVNPGDPTAEEKFKEISEAFSVLSDDQKRRNYDEFGDVSLEGGFDADAARRAREQFGARFGSPGGVGGMGGMGDMGARWEESGEPFAFGNLDDLLGRVFTGRHGPGAGGLRGVDLETTFELEFLEAIRGGERRFTLTPPGAAPETVNVRIPPGVADGGRIRIPQKGAPGAGGGMRGDLFATIRVRPHPVFRREGRDVHLNVPVSVREATFGAKIEIPTLDGRATVTLPPGTDSGQRLRLAGKGVPDPGGGAPGDLFATIQIRVPKGVEADAARSLEEALSPLESEDLRKELFS